MASMADSAFINCSVTSGTLGGTAVAFGDTAARALVVEAVVAAIAVTGVAVVWK